MKNRFLSLISLLLALAVIVLEILPFGAVLNFAAPPGSSMTTRYTYSYFDLLPFGYANFGPLLTAVLSVAILILTIVSLFVKNRPSLILARTVLLGISVVTSLMPLTFGVNYFTVIAVCISVLTVLHSLISVITLKYKE